MIRVPKYPKFGVGDQVTRVAAIAARSGVDLAALAPRSVAIVGSNGKGSTAAFTASIAKAMGATVGAFTSPHLLAVNERFAIGGDAVADDALALAWRAAEAAADAWHEENPDHTLGGFEFLFLVAAKLFQDAQCDAMVWEAGIGGRHDVTRLVRPRCAALTSLDYEHTALLGETLEAIGCDKADICPDGATLLLSETAAAYAGAAIERHVAPRGVRCEVVRAGEFASPLHGAYQRSNTALGARLAQHAFGASWSHCARGLATAVWPGRLEPLAGAPAMMIDVGHTPDAVRQALQGFLDYAGREGRKTLVCGVSRDKDARAIIATLAPSFATIIATSAHHKGLPAEEIAALARSAAPKADIAIAPDIAGAYRAARARPHPVYVAGGLFVAAEFKAVHLGLDPASLAFF